MTQPKPAGVQCADHVIGVWNALKPRWLLWLTPVAIASSLLRSPVIAFACVLTGMVAIVRFHVAVRHRLQKFPCPVCGSEGVILLQHRVSFECPECEQIYDTDCIVRRGKPEKLS